jgi:hypothetical protein
MPCDRCGASVARDDLTHMCDEGRRLDFAFFQLRTEIETFEEQFSCWLETAQGRFERYDAERTRPA